MNSLSDPAASLSPGANGLFAGARGARRMRIAVYVLATTLSIAWTILAGKDLPWDALHYHVYAGFSAINDRLALDFFPAGPQTYLNPYSHLPLYLMVGANLPSLIIGTVFACIHSVMLWMTYELAFAVNRRPDGTAAALVTLLAVLLALMNPVLLQEIGSSFNDISTGILVLAGWAALANAFHTDKRSLVGLAGAVMGAATALKLSNAIFAVAAIPVVLCLDGSAGRRIRALAAFAATGSLVFLIVAGPWAWRMWQVFGNPVFPLLNQVFHSPDFISDPVKHYRFLPDSMFVALMRPIEMMRVARMVHTEVMAPDIRYLFLFAMALPVVVIAAVRKLKAATPAIPADSREVTSARSNRALWSIALGFTVAWVLWLYSSGNSRYFLPMACVAGVLLATGLQRIFAGMKRMLAYVVAILIGAQGFQLWLGTESRWNPSDWTGPWISVTLPERFRNEAFFYLGLESQSNSFLVHYLAPGSAFMSISGGYELTPDGPGGKRAEALIRQNLHRLRMLTQIRSIHGDGTPIPPVPDVLNGSLKRFGLRVDTSDCDYFRLKGINEAVEMATAGVARSGSRDTNYVYTCKVVQASDDLRPYLARKREVDLVFDRVEDACPAFFLPRRSQTVQSGALWRRSYMNTDLNLWINDGGWVKFIDPLRSGGDSVVIGRESDWTKAPPTLTCWKDHGRVFAEIQKN